MRLLSEEKIINAAVLMEKKPVKHKKKKGGIFKNMTIVPRLLIGFFFIAAIGAGMGLYSSFNVDMVSESNLKMYNQMLLPQRSIADISDTFQNTRNNFRNLLLMDEAAMARNIPSLQTYLNYLSSSIETVKPLMSVESSELIDNFQAAIEAYSQKVNTALEDMQSGGKEEVTNDLINAGELYKLEKSVLDCLDKLSTASTKEANGQQLASQKSAKRVTLITYIIIGLEVVISALIAIIIAKSISKPIKRLTKGFKLLAAGDTDISLMDINLKNEIGQMSNAFDSIIMSIKMLNEDTLKLIEAATEGKLSTRADAEKHQGSYRKIIEGFNATLDAVTAPIDEAAQVLGEVSKGNLGTVVTGDLKGDYSIIKDSLNETIETLKGYIGEISSVLSEIARGNLTMQITSDYRGDFTELKDSINQIVGSLNDMLSDIDKEAQQMSLNTKQLSEGSQEISCGATEQASSIEELSASALQIAAQTQQNAKRAADANDLAGKIQTNAVAGNEQMKDMQKAMDEISVSSESIWKIIKVIDEIAFQTGILALNATVEAARAGVHGKGFAVVADEVRNLATKSADAAKETTELIESSIQKVKTGTKIADTTAQAFSEIVNGVEETARLVGDIATASSEQALGIEQINTGIEQLSSVVQRNSATSEESAAASEVLSNRAELMKTMVGRFILSAENTRE